MRIKSVNEFCDFIVTNGDTDEKPNQNGNTIHRMFMPAERYAIDFCDSFSKEHWEQYDTDQDAAYFGVWVNCHSLRVLTYAEGDWTLASCLDNKQYNKEIQSMNEFYGEGRIALAIDMAGNSTEYRQDRDKFLVK